MKNAIKKISAIAMAFTLLGTGTAVSKAINPQTNNALVAHAADAYCPYHACGSYTDLRREVSTEYVGTIKFKVYTIYEIRRCNVCGRFLSKTYVEEHWVQQTFKR